MLVRLFLFRFGLDLLAGGPEEALSAVADTADSSATGVISCLHCLCFVGPSADACLWAPRAALFSHGT